MLNVWENVPAGHWCQVVWLCGSLTGCETLCPPSVAASWHAPAGPSAENATGQEPRFHPLEAPKLPGVVDTDGPVPSAASSSSPSTLISPGLVVPSQMLKPQMICHPKYFEKSGGELYPISPWWTCAPPPAQ